MESSASAARGRVGSKSSCCANNRATDRDTNGGRLERGTMEDLEEAGSIGLERGTMGLEMGATKAS